MAIGDKVGKETVDEINEVTMPKVQGLIRYFFDLLHEFADRFSGTRIICTIEIPPRGSKP